MLYEASIRIMQDCIISLFFRFHATVSASLSRHKVGARMCVYVCVRACVRACVRWKLLGNIHVSNALYISNFKRFVFSHTCRLHSSSSNVNLIQLTMITW